MQGPFHLQRNLVNPAVWGGETNETCSELNVASDGTFLATPDFGSSTLKGRYEGLPVWGVRPFFLSRRPKPLDPVYLRIWSVTSMYVNQYAKDLQELFEAEGFPRAMEGCGNIRISEVGSWSELVIVAAIPIPVG